MPTYEIRKAEPADKEYLRGLHRRCYYDVITTQFGPWDEEWQRQNFDSKWDAEKYQIVQVKGKDLGAISVDYNEDHIFLAEIQIDPAIQSQGLGSAILRSLITEAEQKNLPLRLRVLIANTRARALYERFGFYQIATLEWHFAMEYPSQK